MFPCLGGSAILLLGVKKTTPRIGGFTMVIENSTLLPLNKTKLLYYVNKTIGNLWLYISPMMAPDVLEIAHEKGHLGFFDC